MRNGVALVIVAGLGMVNGLFADVVPIWRQLLFVVFAVAGYLHGRHLPVRHGWRILSAVAVPGVVITILDFAEGIGGLMALGLFVVLPWLAGRFRRQQAELVEAGRERIVQLQREHEIVAERARLRERARIAADIHDSLGHELALIALRAGALELAADMTQRHRHAVGQLRASAVAATDRLRETIGMLREESVPVEPPRESVEVLVDRAASAGMTVSLARIGEVGELPPLVDRAVHRVVQESLTNAARHAPGSKVTVRIEQTMGYITVTVTNSAAESASVMTGNGSGLAGLAERVRLLGGTLSAGPRDGGFTVVAKISVPHREPTHGKTGEGA